MGTQTPDPLNANQVLYQLSYMPETRYLLSQTLIFSNKMSSVIDSFFICLIMAYSP